MIADQEKIADKVDQRTAVRRDLHAVNSRQLDDRT